MPRKIIYGLKTLEAFEIFKKKLIFGDKKCIEARDTLKALRKGTFDYDILDRIKAYWSGRRIYG